MDAQRILSLIATAPALQALRDSGDFGALAAAINAMGLTRVASVSGGIGVIMRALGPQAGGDLLNGLEAQAATNSAVRWALVLIERGDLDFGDDTTRSMIDALCPAPVAAALKAVAEVPDTTDHLQVMQALEI